MTPTRAGVLLAMLTTLPLNACSKTTTDLGDGERTVASVVVTSAATTLTSLGETTTATATAMDASGVAIGGVSFTWASSDVSVMSVTAGRATAVSNGTAAVTATADGVVGSVDILVAQAAVAASVEPADSVYRSGTQLLGSAVDALGGPVPGAVTWESLAPGVATVDTAGVLAPVSTGVVRVRVEAGGFADTTTVRLIWNVVQMSDLFPLHEFSATVAGQSVYSDLSQAHADEHAAILSDAWAYFDAMLTGTGLTQVDFYFTAWSEIWAEYNPFCGGVFFENQTLWQRCAAPYPRHFLTTEEGSDSRNVVRFLAHEFLRFSYPDADPVPWLKEGLGGWSGSGSFDTGGQLVVTGPETVLIDDFRTGDSQGLLESLDSLTTLPAASYYQGLPGRTPVAVRNAQATMFWGYLALNYPGATSAVFDGINTQQITDNAGLVASILGSTGLTLQELETAYLAYARSL